MFVSVSVVQTVKCALKFCLTRRGTCSEPGISADPLIRLHSGHQRLVELECRRQSRRRVYDGHTGKQHLPYGESMQLFSRCGRHHHRRQTVQSVWEMLAHHHQHEGSVAGENLSLPR